MRNIACTRTSEELLGARKAYHSLFDRSLEEDIVSLVDGVERKLLLALVSAYSYEGSKVKDETAKSEARALSATTEAAHEKPILEDEEHYKELYGKNLDEDLDDLRLKENVQCLCSPVAYFIQVLDAALRFDADKNTKKALTRVIVTRADTYMMQIMDEYQRLYGASLTQKIEDTTNGNFKDFLLTLMARSG
ncbi:hypothetical protein K1719_013523 [Acacia pycnantha]|nr:hypothetical protein K1719_013523 [Acacia pycnantha]